MLSALQALEFFHDKKIRKEACLLIDDDKDNVRIATANGVRAIHLDPNHPERLFADIMKLQ